MKTTSPQRKTNIDIVYVKFNNIFDNLCINSNVMFPQNLEIILNSFNVDKNSINKSCFITDYREIMNDMQSEGFSIWATDASVKQNTTAIRTLSSKFRKKYLL